MYFLETKSIGSLVDTALNWLLLIAKRSQFERANGGCFGGQRGPGIISALPFVFYAAEVERHTFVKINPSMK